jgi:HxlR-like helix-turn-helix
VCSVARTLEAIGDRWTMLIVRDAFLGVRRFDDFQRDLGIARNVLSDRLARLVADPPPRLRRGDRRALRLPGLRRARGRSQRRGRPGPGARRPWPSAVL